TIAAPIPTAASGPTDEPVDGQDGVASVPATGSVECTVNNSIGNGPLGNGSVVNGSVGTGSAGALVDRPIDGPTFVLPVPSAPAPPPPPTDLAQVLASLPTRAQKLFRRIVAAGSIGTQDHMQTAGVSHRTGLRDLQSLVEAGLVQRVGSRRGARYRPSPDAQ